MSLADYKLDKAFTDGVKIHLDEETCFLVKLPSQYNRAYTQAQYEHIALEIDEDGAARPVGGAEQFLIAKYAVEDAFVKHCIISVNGEPVPDNFAEHYPQAVTELMEKATELANAIESRVDKSVKKSLNSLTGNANGQESKASIGSLKVEAG